MQHVPTRWERSWSLGQALLDLNDPGKVKERLAHAFIKAEFDWEKKGFTPNACVANGLVPFKGEWLLYYGAADRRIGLAICESESKPE